MKLKLLSILYLCCLVQTAQAVGYYEWTPKARAAYQKVMQFRFEEANALLDQVKLDEPNNLIVYHVENYIDFFRVFVNESRSEFNKLQPRKEEHLRLLKGGDSSSPYHLYTQANIMLHWALARLKFEEYTTAFFEVNEAFKLLDKNDKKFPDFMPNKKELGILHAMVGTIPDNYKWGVTMLSSLDGTIQQGQAEMESVIQFAKRNDFIYEEEAMALYAYLLLHFGNEKEESWKMLQSSNINPSTNPLAAFVLANVAMRTDRNDNAIAVLKKAPKGAGYHAFPYLDFMLGTAKLRRGDKDADVYLNRFLTSFKGKNFIKEAWQKIAWSALLKGDIQTYKSAMANVKKRGAAVVDSDKSALKEANSPSLPNRELLRARLLYDGGYYQKAYNQLGATNSAFFVGQHDQLEYYYRMGRILHKLNKEAEAHTFYQKAIDLGKTAPWYFACNAALQRGLIYEAQRDKTSAKKYFTLCLSIKPDEHKTGLHQQAKAGLGRLR